MPLVWVFSPSKSDGAPEITLLVVQSEAMQGCAEEQSAERGDPLPARVLTIFGCSGHTLTYALQNSLSLTLPAEKAGF